jgi:NitT/TauT family transport system substrate-binding protein
MGHTRVSPLVRMAVGSLAIALLAAACGGSGNGSGGSATGKTPGGTAAMTRVVVGALPIIDTAGLQVAIKEGYFKQAGLDVIVQADTQSTSAIPDMLHGSIDIIGGANYVSFFEAQAHGTLPLKVLAQATDCTADTYGVVALPSSGITKPVGLAGKTIAVNLTNNIQTLTTNAVLAVGGVSTSSVHYVQIPFPDMISALQAHRVDAISVVEPFLAAAEAAGGKLVTSTCTGSVASFPLSGYVTTQSWAQQHATTARAFQKALEKGQAYANAHPNVIRNLLPTYTKITAKAAASMPLSTYPSTLTAAPMQRVATLMRGGGLATPSDVGSLLFH